MVKSADYFGLIGHIEFKTQNLITDAVEVT